MSERSNQQIRLRSFIRTMNSCVRARVCTHCICASVCAVSLHLSDAVQSVAYVYVCAFLCVCLLCLGVCAYTHMHVDVHVFCVRVCVVVNRHLLRVCRQAPALSPVCCLLVAVHLLRWGGGWIC